MAALDDTSLDSPQDIVPWEEAAMGSGKTLSGRGQVRGHAVHKTSGVNAQWKPRPSNPCRPEHPEENYHETEGVFAGGRRGAGRLGLVPDRSGPHRGPNKPAEQERGEPAKPAAEPREAPRAFRGRVAVRKATAEFIKAVEKGDAKAVAAFWTEQGEYIGDEGTTLRGRAAIEAAYAKAFARNKNLKVEMTVESIRFPSKDTAIEEGYARSYHRNADYPTTSRYSVLHVREGGRWLDGAAARVARRGRVAARPRLAHRHLGSQDRGCRGADHL